MVDYFLFHVKKKNVIRLWPYFSNAKHVCVCVYCYIAGRVFNWGVYRNTYVVYDEDNNGATCTFYIVIRSKWLSSGGCHIGVYVQHEVDALTSS